MATQIKQHTVIVQRAASPKILWPRYNWPYGDFTLCNADTKLYTFVPDKPYQMLLYLMVLQLLVWGGDQGFQEKTRYCAMGRDKRSRF